VPCHATINRYGILTVSLIPIDPTIIRTIDTNFYRVIPPYVGTIAHVAGILNLSRHV